MKLTARSINHAGPGCVVRGMLVMAPRDTKRDAWKWMHRTLRLAARQTDAAISEMASCLMAYGRAELLVNPPILTMTTSVLTP